MSKYNKQQILAFQIAWARCINDYFFARGNEELRFSVIDDFVDTLVDIDEKKENNKILTKYLTWENETWLPLIKKELYLWKIKYPFEANDQDNKEQHEQFLKKTYNRKRYHKILEIIQRSDIGLGSSKERGHYELSGYMGETTQ